MIVCVWMDDWLQSTRFGWWCNWMDLNEVLLLCSIYIDSNGFWWSIQCDSVSFTRFTRHLSFRGKLSKMNWCPLIFAWPCLLAATASLQNHTVSLAGSMSNRGNPAHGNLENLVVDHCCAIAVATAGVVAAVIYQSFVHHHQPHPSDRLIPI